MCLGWGTWRKQLQTITELEAALEVLLSKPSLKEEETGV